MLWDILNKGKHPEGGCVTSLGDLNIFTPNFEAEVVVAVNKSNPLFGGRVVISMFGETQNLDFVGVYAKLGLCSRS